MLGFVDSSFKPSPFPMCDNSQSAASPWPHRLAVALACATFPLVWVGGLVTTTGSGMAVPDWPNTYGYNLFLYPLSTWLAGPWDIFVEHGHRLLGAAIGMLTIALLSVLWQTEDRDWMRWFGVAALGLVVFQGVLGGMRVIFNERTLAMLHGSTAPLFFAMTVAMAVFTSKRWLLGTTDCAADNPADTGHIRQLAVVTWFLVYLQILLGAVLRHVPIVTEPATFALVVWFHLFMAGILMLHILVLVWAVLRQSGQWPLLRWLAIALVVLFFGQLSLGITTWLLKYSVPYWASEWVPSVPLTIVDNGWLQTHVVTTHVAVGSLLLATSLAIALYSLRLLAVPRPLQVGLEVAV
jgi:cytochrome c oxidase assembly protein subunit 15